MENTELPLENSGKTGKPPRRDRVARCVCSNEWTAHNGNEEKPSRCPVCKSRDVKWRDECTDEELGNTGKPLEFQNSSMENQNSTDGKMELPLEKPEKQISNSVTGNSYPIKTKSSKIPDKETTGKDDLEFQSLEEIQKNFTGIPALPLILLMGLLGVAGLIFFLWGQAKKRREARLRKVAKPQEIPYEGRAVEIMRQRLGENHVW
jgi:hypothetical protein